MHHYGIDLHRAIDAGDARETVFEALQLAIGDHPSLSAHYPIHISY